MTKAKQKKEQPQEIASKDKLFLDFFIPAIRAFQTLEILFGISGVKDQVFGKDASEDSVQAQNNLRASNAWATLCTLYDYAVNGEETDHPIDIVGYGADVISLVRTASDWPQKWDRIVTMANGRFGLDEGQAVALEDVALLGNVSVRTVRNAVSAGELVSAKTSSGAYIENASARHWLLGRRGFKPTVSKEGAEQLSLDKVSRPVELGAFLSGQRARLGLGNIDDKLVVSHASVTPQALAQLESGVFAMPLDAVFPLADFYQVNRKAFLECVMRVFFNEELDMLCPVSAKETR